MPNYDQLNSSLAPSKSVFDSQRLTRPSVYRQCGRASLAIGAACLLAEISVFIAKRGLTTTGVGIWTGAPFAIFGAAAMAVPRTRTVCSVSVVFAMAAACMAVSGLGAAACVWHIRRIADVLSRRSTPRPDFELSCRGCGYYIMLKEVAQIGLLLLQFLVASALACFAHRDCLCCCPTETEVIMSAAGVVESDSQHRLPALGAAPATPTAAVVSSGVAGGTGVVGELRQTVAGSGGGGGNHWQQQYQRQPVQQQQLNQTSMSASLGPLPMLYDL